MARYILSRHRITGFLMQTPTRIRTIRRASRRIFVPLVVALVGSLLTPPAGAQETRLFTLSFIAGVGSAADSAHADANNLSLQAAFTAEVDAERLIGVRIGRIGFDSSDVVNDHAGPSLTYATVAGGYRLHEAIYDSGVYLGLGLYRLSGESRPGVVLGYTGEFEINRRWSVLLELSGHYANFRHDQTFAQAMGGLEWHF